MPRPIMVFSVLCFVLVWAAPLIQSDSVLGASDPHMRNFHFFSDRPPAYDFPMETVGGARIRLRDFLGKVVLLNFWRKNCFYCKKEKKLLSRMVKTFNRPDLVVICVDLWDSPNWVKRAARAYSGTMLFAMRAGKQKAYMENIVRGRPMGLYILNAAREAVYEVKGFPTTYVIDKTGRVVAGHLGMADWTAPSIRKWIGTLLAAGPTTTVAAHEYQGLPPWLDRILAGRGSLGPTDRRPAHGPRVAPR